MDEFTVTGMEDGWIEVVDNVTGHRFTWDVHEDEETRIRILTASGRVRINDRADLSETQVARRVRNFAEMTMLKAGKIDRITIANLS